MTPEQLYKLLDDAGVEYDVVESFEGSRWIRVDVVEHDDPIVDLSTDCDGNFDYTEYSMRQGERGL